MVENTTRRGVLKTTGSSILVGATLGLAGCLGGNGDGGGDGNGNGGGEEFEITVANIFNPEHTQTQLASRFVDNIEEMSDGRITGEVLAASIGGEEDQIEAAASGSVDIHGTGMPALTEAHGEEYGFLESPFIVQSWDHFLAMSEEYVHGDDGFNQQLREQANQEILLPSYRGWRGLTSNFPGTHPDTVQGVQIRLPQFETWVRTWEEIGAEATPVAFDELYSALQTGVVEASEGPIQQFMDTSLYEVQSHFSVTDHMLQTHQWVAATPFLDSLSDEDESMVMDSLEEAIEWANQQTRDETEELYEAAEDEGTTVVYAEDVDQEAFREAGQPAVEEFFETTWDADFEEVQSLA